MQKSVEFCQLVTRAITYTTWKTPRIRDGDRWRNIRNSDLVVNQKRANAHDYYEDAILRIKSIMKQKGYQTKIKDTKERCHEHLYYQHYRLTCWK